MAYYILQRLLEVLFGDVPSGGDRREEAPAVSGGKVFRTVVTGVGFQHVALLVVVGTDECTYYTKSMTLHSERFGGPGGRCVSVVLDGHDVTFGSTPKMHKAFKEIVAE